MADVRPEAELLLLAISTRKRRRERAARMGDLLGRVDFGRLVEVARRQRLLTLLGTRLESAAAARLPASFKAAVEANLHEIRLRCTLQNHFTHDVVEGLRSHGVRAVVLKGPSLGERLYRDPSLRSSNDIDLLVSPEQFHSALRGLAEQGYEHLDQGSWIGSLPLFETSLVGTKEWAPPIDLHWRVHWHELDFSRRLMARAGDSAGLLVPDPVDEFATILLMYARDAFQGARGAADAAAWWDAREPQSEQPLLGEIIEQNPKLRRVLATSAAVVEDLVGIPAHRIVAQEDLTAQPSLPVRLQNHSLERSTAEQEAASTLIDWLLTPRGQRRDFVRRHLFLPSEVVAKAYGRQWPRGPALWLLQLRYGLVMVARLAPHWVSVLWRVRRGRRLVGIAGAGS
jgi:hypothetical protein